MSTTLPVLHLIAACVYTGLQLTVWRLVYPLLAATGQEDLRSGTTTFGARHRQETHRITVLVGPMFLALLVTSALLVITRPGAPAAWVAAAATLGLLGSTGLGAVPAHRDLSGGFTARAMSRLQRWDRVRLGFAVVQVVTAVVLVPA